LFFKYIATLLRPEDLTVTSLPTIRAMIRMTVINSTGVLHHPEHTIRKQQREEELWISLVTNKAFVTKVIEDL